MQISENEGFQNDSQSYFLTSSPHPLRVNVSYAYTHRMEWGVGSSLYVSYFSLRVSIFIIIFSMLGVIVSVFSIGWYYFGLYVPISSQFFRFLYFPRFFYFILIFPIFACLFPFFFSLPLSHVAMWSYSNGNIAKWILSLDFNSFRVPAPTT